MDRDAIQLIYRQMLFSSSNVLSEDDPALCYIMDSIPKAPDTCILDAGCGNGKYARHLAGAGYQCVHAVDLFADIDLRGVHYVRASLEELPYSDAYFDFVYSNSAVYYLEPPECALREFARVLKPGGIVLITAHNRYSPFTIWRVIQRNLLKRRKLNHLQGVHFRPASYYRKILLAHGFDLVLQDGFGWSFMVYPAYLNIAKRIDRALGVSLPRKKPYITRNTFLGRCKSECAYHCVIIAEKRVATSS